VTGAPNLQRMTVGGKGVEPEDRSPDRLDFQGALASAWVTLLDPPVSQSKASIWHIYQSLRRGFGEICPRDGMEVYMPLAGFDFNIPGFVGAPVARVAAIKQVSDRRIGVVTVRCKQQTG
jgi:hypothetical protein